MTRPRRNHPITHAPEESGALGMGISVIFPDDLNVLDGYVNAMTGYGALLPVIRFDEAVWDFRSVLGVARTIQPNEVMIDWRKFSFAPERPLWMIVLKEMATAMLCPQHPIVINARLPRFQRDPLPLGSVQRKVLKWARWLRWLQGRGVLHLGQVTQDHCDAYLAHAHKCGQPQHVMDLVTAVRDFSAYSGVLSERYPERFSPWGERSTAKVVGYRKSFQNTTPWIPEDVFDTLLAGALLVIDKPANDIIAAHQELCSTGRAQDLDRSRFVVDRKLPILLDHYRVQGRPLPAACRYDGVPLADAKDSLRDVNINWLGKQAGLWLVHSGLTARHRAMLENALSELGTEPGGMATRVSEIERLDGSKRPWREPFSPRSVHECVNRLVDACFIVIAGLTGMRYSEVLALRRGCVATETDEYGHKWYRVYSRIFKGQPLGGKKDSWRVIEPVKRAIEVLEELAPEGDEQLLFMGGRTARVESNEGYVPDFGRRLDTFRTWQNTHGQVAGLPEIPDVGERPWHLYPNQFRRTLARELAFRPHGIIAAKVHLKHVRAAITEGYAGPPGEGAQEFLRELEQEDAAANEEVMRRRFEEWSANKVLTGGCLPRLAEEFAAIEKDLEGFKGTIDQRNKRLTELLRKRTGKVHIGILNDCHFDPLYARCLRARGIEHADGPIIPACEPGRCANALIAAEHVPRWQQSLKQLKELRRDRKIPQHERERLGDEERRIERVIAPFIQQSEDSHGSA